MGEAPHVLVLLKILQCVHPLHPVSGSSVVFLYPEITNPFSLVHGTEFFHSFCRRVWAPEQT